MTQEEEKWVPEQQLSSTGAAKGTSVQPHRYPACLMEDYSGGPRAEDPSLMGCAEAPGCSVESAVP